MANDKTATATVPIDEDILRFAIDLDEMDQKELLPLYRDLALIFESIREAGEDGMEAREAAEVPENTDTMKHDLTRLVYELHQTEQFKEHEITENIVYHKES